jgi:DnaD/phage-associated family protein
MQLQSDLPHAYTLTAGAITSQMPVLITNLRHSRFDNNLPIGEATKSTPVPFTRIPDAVLLDGQLTPIQFRIYAVIARRAGRESASAFPSYNTIAEDAHISRRSAINGVKALVKSGYLAKRPQESGQGDATSNLYTISGEGSEIFAPRGVPTDEVVQSLHHGSAECARQVVQNLHHGSAEFAPQVVQQMHHGSANAAPELDSVNKKKSNKIQDNQIAPARTHEASAAAAADPELEGLFSDFQENIGALTAISKQVITDLAAEFSAPTVYKAVQEAVIYEKRSLAYVRRVLGAWKRNDCSPAKNSDASSTSHGAWNSSPAMDQATNPDLVWPPPDIDSWRSENADPNNPAVAAWYAISSRVPELGRYVRVIEPKSLTDNVLTVSVPDQRTYNALTNGLNNFINRATYSVLGSATRLRVEINEQRMGAEALSMPPT